MTSLQPYATTPKYEKYLSFLIVAAVVIAGFVRLRFGLDISDEGLYLSAPFRDAAFGAGATFSEVTVGRWFDLVILPVMKMLPDYGSILAIRYFGYILHIAGIGALFFTARRLVSPLLLSACFAAAFHANVYSLWTPSYIDMPVSFTCLALACVIESHQRGAGVGTVLLGIIAGFCFSTAILCYGPLFLLLPIPGAVILLSLLKKNLRLRGYAVCLYAAAATIAAFYACYIMYLSGHGYLDNVAATLKFLRSNASYSGTTSRIFSLLGQYLEAGPASSVILLSLVLVIIAGRKNLGGDRRAATITLALGALVFMAHLAFSLPLILEGTIAATAAAYVVFRIFAPGGGDKSTYLIDGVAIFSVAWYGLVGLVSVGGAFTATYVVPPLFLVLAHMVERLFFARKNADHRFGLAVVLLVLVMAGNTTLRSFYHSFMNPPVTRQTARASFGRLNGIYASPERVGDIEELLEYLDARMEPGDYLLAFDYFSMLYYLADARPALRTCFVVKKWTPPVLQEFVDEMVDRGRVPEYAVRLLVWPRNLEDPATAEPMEYSTDPAKDPLFSFVSGHYTLEKSIGPYEIWKLNPGEYGNSGND